MSYGAGGVSGAAEIDADEALGRVCAASAAALDSAESSPPDGAGFSAILGWVLLDGEGKPLRPAMIWADTRATRESEALAARIGPELFYERSARRLSPELLLPELLWLETHEAGTFGKLATVLSLKDYIVGRLTGTRATDRATASYTGFVDVDSLVEDESLLGTVGLRKGLLPRIASATELAGRASGELCAGGAPARGDTRGARVHRRQHGHVRLGSPPARRRRPRLRDDRRAHDRGPGEAERSRDAAGGESGHGGRLSSSRAAPWDSPAGPSTISVRSSNNGYGTTRTTSRACPSTRRRPSPCRVCRESALPTGTRTRAAASWASVRGTGRHISCAR